MIGVDILKICLAWKDSFSIKNILGYLFGYPEFSGLPSLCKREREKGRFEDVVSPSSDLALCWGLNHKRQAIESNIILLYLRLFELFVHT